MMTLPQAQLDEIRRYLQEQAGARTVEELIAAVQHAAGELAAAAQAFTAEAFEATPEGEEWSPAACLRHVMERNLEVAQQVLYVALSGELPGGTPAPLPDGREEALAAHAAGLESLFAHVREAAPDGFLSVTWPHQFFGELNWREWLLFIRVHCRDHAGQLRAMLDA